MTDVQNIFELQHALDAVAPNYGVSIDDPYDKSTWRVDFNDATDEQKKQAAAVINAFFVRPVHDIENEKNRRLAAGFTFDGRTYQDNQSGFATLRMEALLETISPTNKDIFWIDAQNNIVKLTPEVALALCDAAYSWRSNLVLKCRELKNDINSNDYKNDRHW